MIAKYWDNANGWHSVILYECNADSYKEWEHYAKWLTAKPKDAFGNVSLQFVKG